MACAWRMLLFAIVRLVEEGKENEHKENEIITVRVCITIFAW